LATSAVRAAHTDVSVTANVYQHVIEDAQQGATEIAGNVIERLTGSKDWSTPGRTWSTAL